MSQEENQSYAFGEEKEADTHEPEGGSSHQFDLAIPPKDLTQAE